MRLAVSNIAWLPEEDPAVRGVLLQAGVDAVEVAPTRLWSDPTSVREGEARDAAARFSEQGLEVVSFQSLLFARPELTLFGDASVRRDLADYLCAMVRLAGWMGAGRLVFGSPKSRRVPPGMSAERALEIAADFFRAVGSAAAAEGTVLCIEPNPPVYSCNFITTADEGIALVEAVDSSGFGLHLDSAGAVLAGDDPAAAVWSAGARLRHVHASAPELQELEAEVVDHFSFAAALRSIDYDGVVAIEMRAGAAGLNAQRVAAAIALAQGAYRA